MNGTISVQTYTQPKVELSSAQKTSSESSGDSFRDMVSQVGKDQASSGGKVPDKDSAGKPQTSGKEEGKEEKLPAAADNTKEAADQAAQMAAQAAKEALTGAVQAEPIQMEIQPSFDVKTDQIFARAPELSAEIFKMPEEMTGNRNITAPEGVTAQTQLTKEFLGETAQFLANGTQKASELVGRPTPQQPVQEKGEESPSKGQPAAQMMPEGKEADSPHSTAAGPSSENTEFSYKTQGKTENPNTPEAQAMVVTGREALVRPDVGETVHIKVAEPYYSWNPEFSGKLSSSLLKNLAVGRNEFEIQLEPENLGKILVKVSFTEEGARVVLSCTNEKTMGLLTENAKSIGTIVENNTGNATVVEVKQEQNGYWNQQRDTSDQNSGRESGNGQNSRKKQDEDERADFIQQLRLGLLGTPDTLAYDALLG